MSVLVQEQDMSDNKCKWKPKYLPVYKCHEPPLSSDLNGYCILHSEREDKGIDEFTRKVDERMTKGRLTHSGWLMDKIDLVGCYFPSSFRSNYFIGRKFDEPVNFRQAKFFQAFFVEAKFSQVAIFTGATFLREADFRRATFSQNADFTGAKFSWVDFNGVKFSHEANFYTTTFSHRADFSLATFSQRACFSSTTFTREARFIDTTFVKEADFREAKFLAQAYFTGAEFSIGANFIEAEFLQANFTKTTFSESADFFRAKISQADFEGTIFVKKARFDNTEFTERAFFVPFGEGDKKRNVVFGPASSFRYTRFLGEVRFQDVDLCHCSFLYSNIDKIDFRYCTFGKEKV